jgi:hypothetical protein
MMNTQIVGTAQGKARGGFGRLMIVLGLGLALVLVAAALLSLRSAQESRPTAFVQAARAELQVVDPAHEAVLAYLRAHGATTTSPNTAFSWDPALEAVFDYLEAHGWQRPAE